MTGPNHDPVSTPSHEAGDISGRSSRGISLTLLVEGYRGAVSLITLLILARLLTPDDFGLVAMVAVVIAFAEIVRNLGLGDVTIQKAELTWPELSALFWANAALGVVLTVMVALAAPIIALFFDRPELVAIVQVMALNTLIGALSTQPDALMRRQMTFGRRAVVQTTATTISAGLGLSLAFNGAGVWALVAVSLSTASLTLIGNLIASRFRFVRPASFRTIAPSIRFGGQVAAFHLINFFAIHIDRILLGRYFGAADLALYARARTMMTGPTRRLFEPLRQVIIPALSRYQDAPESYIKYLHHVLTRVNAAMLPLMLFVAIWAEEILALLFGDQWIAAAPMAQALAVAGMFRPVNVCTSWVMTSQGRANDLMVWGMIGASILIASIIIGLQWGPVGVAISYSLANVLIATPLLHWWVGRKGPVGPFAILRSLLPALPGAIGPLLSASLLFIPTANQALTFTITQNIIWTIPWNLGIAVTIALPITFLSYMAFPQGREILRDGVTLVKGRNIFRPSSSPQNAPPPGP